MLLLKPRVPNLEFRPVAPQGKAPGCEFTPDWGSPHRERVYGKSVSQPLLPTSEFVLFVCTSCFNILSYSFYVILLCDNMS